MSSAFLDSYILETPELHASFLRSSRFYLQNEFGTLNIDSLFTLLTSNIVDMYVN